MSVAHHAMSAAPSLSGTRWFDRVKVAVAGVVSEWRVQRDLRQLQELDGAALHDIGLAPGGLEGAVRYGRRTRGLAAAAPLPMAPGIPSSLTEWR